MEPLIYLQLIFPGCTHLASVFAALEKRQYVITVPEDVSGPSRALDRILEIK